MNDELKKLLDIIIKEKGGSYKDYRLLMDKIGYHESKSDYKAIQKLNNGKNGLGRGKYQFEVGDNKGANTAVNRTYRYMKENGITPPQWLNDVYKNKSTDASKLKDYQQDIMFLGNMMGHPKANFKNVIDGKESTVDFWSKYHWAGKNKDLEARTKSFNDSMEHYKQPEPEAQVDLMQYLTKSPKEKPQIYPQENPANQFAKGGLLNEGCNCGCPGKPPCDDKIPDLKSFTEDNRKVWKERYNSDTAYFLNYLEKVAVGTNRPLKEIILEYSKKHNISPNVLYTTALAEGLDTYKFKKDLNSKYNNYLQDPSAYTGDDKILGKQDFIKKFFNTNVSGYQHLGLDTIGDVKDKLISGNYLSEDFFNNKTSIESRTNEKGESIKTSNFNNLNDGINALAAFLKFNNDKLHKWTTSNNITLSPNQKAYFENVAYNAGDANAHKMISSFNKQGFLKNDDFIKKFPTKSWGGIHKNVSRRYGASKAFKEQNIFNTTKPKVKGINKLPYVGISMPKFNLSLIKPLLLNNNTFAEGGRLNSNINQSEFNKFNEGGSHQENPHGGIPMGIGRNGKFNTVEENETSYDFEDGKYIFSARLGFDKKLQGQNSSNNNQFADGGKLNNKCGGPGQPPCEELKKIEPYLSGDKYLINEDNIKTSKNRILDYLNSPGFERILSKSEKQNTVNNIKIDRINKVKNLKINQRNQISEKGPGYFYGIYNQNTDKSVDLENYLYKGIPEHEISHASTDGNNNLNEFTKNNIKKRITHKRGYYNDPTEAHARIINTRLLLKHANIWDYNKREFNSEDLKKLKKDLKENPDKYRIQDFLDLKEHVNSDEDFIWLMNNIAQTDIKKQSNTRLT